MSVSLERVFRIWDSAGYFIQIAEDADGLGMMEISYWNDSSAKIEQVSIPSGMFDLFMEAASEFIESKEEEF